MLHNTGSYSVRFELERRHDLEPWLDQAVEAAIREARRNPGQGILVTRHDHRSFTVELSEDIPHGLIRERDLRDA